jgi:hypothetical protein
LQFLDSRPSLGDQSISNHLCGRVYLLIVTQSYRPGEYFIDSIPRDAGVIACSENDSYRKDADLNMPPMPPRQDPGGRVRQIQ